MSTKTPTSESNAPETLNFEDSIEALENIVASLEGGDLSLEESLSTFEKGVQLTKACQRHLSQAEQKIELLTASGEAVTFTSDQGNQ